MTEARHREWFYREFSRVKENLSVAIKNERYDRETCVALLRNLASKIEEDRIVGVADFEQIRLHYERWEHFKQERYAMAEMHDIMSKMQGFVDKE